MVNWEQDWAKASVEDVTEALSVLANATGGVEQPLMDKAVELLGYLHSTKATPR